MTRPALLPAERPEDCDCEGLNGTLPCVPCYWRGFKLPDPDA